MNPCMTRFITATRSKRPITPNDAESQVRLAIHQKSKRYSGFPWQVPQKIRESKAE